MKRESFNKKYQPVLVPVNTRGGYELDLFVKDESLDSRIAELNAVVIEEENPTISMRVRREGYNGSVEFECQYKGIDFIKNESVSNSIPFLKSEGFNKGVWTGKVFFDKQGKASLIRMYVEE